MQFEIGEAFRGVFCLVNRIAEMRLQVPCFSCFKTRDAGKVFCKSSKSQGQILTL